MRVRYVVEVQHKGKISYPKTSDNISELREWIYKKYPSAIQLPILPSEYLGEWYIEKYATHIISHLTRKEYSSKASTIYIKKTF